MKSRLALCLALALTLGIVVGATEPPAAADPLCNIYFWQCWDACWSSPNLPACQDQCNCDYNACMGWGYCL